MHVFFFQSSLKTHICLLWESSAESIAVVLLIVSIFKICRKGKVTFSLVISTAGKLNQETSSTGLTWPLDQQTRGPLPCGVDTGLRECILRPPRKERKSPDFVPRSSIVPTIVFSDLPDNSSKVQTLWLDWRVSDSLSKYSQSKARSSQH